MRVVFVSNYLNHHQIPFCKAMQRITDGNFFFLAMEEMTEERKNMGWDLKEEYDFQIEVKENKERAKQLVMDADVVIGGGSSYMWFIRERVEANKLTFWNSERIYKKGLWRAISPRGIYYMTRDHGRYRNKNLYLLCSSAYAPLDFSLTGSYIGKTYKWGYFPEFKEYDVKHLLEKKDKKTINILWVSRFIDLKHPEIPLVLAEELRNSNIDFHITMIGNGSLLNDYIKKVETKKLSDVITIKSAFTPLQVREYMEIANIFIFTSDFNEGWGAVLNEAMNSGCAVVTSHAIGATPFLVKDKENGLVYKNGDFEDFSNKVKLLIDDVELGENLGRAAYETILNEWNADIAAERLVELSKALLDGKKLFFESGPCSKAKIITGKWYKNN